MMRDEAEGVAATADLAGAAEPTSPREGGRALPFATVAVHASLAAAAADWSRLEAVADASPYQRRAWLDAWIATEGRAMGVTPFIVTAYDCEQAPVALLPLGIRAAGGLRRAMFLGGRETNYNMGLYDRRLRWREADVDRLLRQAGRGAVDLYAFVNQPRAWGDFGNPAAGLGRTQPSPSSSHRAVLQHDAEAFLRAHQSAAGRKKLRSKATHLATLGALEHRVARTPEDIKTVLEAHIRQKAAKMAAIGVAAPDFAAVKALFARAAAPPGGPVELHALFCGPRIVATFGGLAHRGRFSGLLISYDLDPAYARASPGELLLVAVLRQKCAEGFESFDLGVGEARYKDAYCPIEDPLVDSFLPLTLAGTVASAASATALRLKRVVKRSPRAWASVQAIRRRAAGLRRIG